MNVIGVIEGFYGPPWKHEERLDLIRFCGAEGFNTWVHAPKDDPYHRKRWREAYPADELQQLAELVEQASANGVEFVYAVAPGLDVVCDRDGDLAALVSKCAQLQGIGVRSFQLLWDDLEPNVAPSAEEQATFSNRFAHELAQPGPLVVCPQGYAGTEQTPYRRTFGSRLEPGVVLYWTGPEIVSHEITRDQLDAAVGSFCDHELLLWDNYPANDFSPHVLYLAPLQGRDALLATGDMHGIVANPMVQAIPSKLALATVAQWARDPAAYEPATAYARALRRYGAEVVAFLGTPRPNGGPRPDDLEALICALAGGVDAGTAATLLERFV